MRQVVFLASLIAGVFLLFAGAPRYDKWQVIGPGGGGGQFSPTISPHTPDDVLAACDMTGSFISHDGGESWRMFNLGLRAGFFVFDPVDRRVIYAKTIGPPAIMAKDRPLSLAGLWRSTDSGRTWRLVRADPSTSPGSAGVGPAGDLMALAVDPANSRSLLAVLQEGASSALYASTDWGRSWSKAGELPGGGQSIDIDPRSPGGDRTVYVAGSASVAIRQGGRWLRGTELPMPSPAGPGGAQPARFSMGFPSDGGQPVVYASTTSAAFVSDDGGRTWRSSELPGFAPRLKTIATSPRHPNVAYLSYDYRPAQGERFHGAAKTRDRGRTWELVWKEYAKPAPNILDAWLSELSGPGWGGSPGDMSVAPSNPDICYGTDSGRTMRTTDGGKTWAGVYSKRQPDGSYASTGSMSQPPTAFISTRLTPSGCSSPTPTSVSSVARTLERAGSAPVKGCRHGGETPRIGSPSTRRSGDGSGGRWPAPTTYPAPRCGGRCSR